MTDMKRITLTLPDEAAATLTASYSAGGLDVLITSQAEFAEFMKQAKKNYKGVLQNDLSLSGYRPEYSFLAILDGNGYAVIADSTYEGLVTNNEGTIKNLSVKGVARTSVAAICMKSRDSIESCANKTDFSNYERHFTAKTEVLFVTQTKQQALYATAITQAS